MKEVTVKVVENALPVMYCGYLNNGTPLVLEVGQKFDVSLLDAQVLDKEDGELEIEYVGADKVDTTKASTDTASYQKVLLKATDKNGAKVEKTAYIKVVENTAPRFEVKDGEFSVEVALKSTVTKESILKALELKAYDRQGSENAIDITSTVDVLYVENVNTNIKGDYTVMLTATEKGQTTTKLVTVKVAEAKEEQATPAPNRTNPEVFFNNADVKGSGSNYTLTVRQYSKFTVDMLGATAKDAMDNIVKVELTKGTVDTTKTGANELTLVATDSLGRKTTVTVTVTVEGGSSSQQATEAYISLTDGESKDINTTVNGDRVTIKKDIISQWAVGQLNEKFQEQVKVELKQTSDNKDIDTIEVSFEGLKDLVLTSTEWQTVKVNVTNTATNQIVTKTIFVQIAE